MTKLALPTRNSLRLDEVSSTLFYVGEAAFNQAETSPVWRIKRIQTVGSVMKVEWANGNDAFQNIWSDRASLSYS